MKFTREVRINRCDQQRRLVSDPEPRWADTVYVEFALMHDGYETRGAFQAADRVATEIGAIWERANLSSPDEYERRPRMLVTFEVEDY